MAKASGRRAMNEAQTQEEEPTLSLQFQKYSLKAVANRKPALKKGFSHKKR